MLNALKHAHSGLRWIVLALLIYAIFNAFKKWRSGEAFLPQDKKANLFALIAVHIRPKVSFGPETMKDSYARFFAVEHMSMMIIAIILITLGYSLSKRAINAPKKFKQTFIFYLIGLLIMLLSIPWPFQSYGAGWF